MVMTAAERQANYRRNNKLSRHSSGRKHAVPADIDWENVDCD